MATTAAATRDGFVTDGCPVARPSCPDEPHAALITTSATAASANLPKRAMVPLGLSHNFDSYIFITCDVCGSGWVGGARGGEEPAPREIGEGDTPGRHREDSHQPEH